MNERQDLGTSLLVFAVEWSVAVHVKLTAATTPAALTFVFVSTRITEQLNKLTADTDEYVKHILLVLTSKGYQATGEETTPSLLSVLIELAKAFTRDPEFAGRALGWLVRLYSILWVSRLRAAVALTALAVNKWSQRAQYLNEQRVESYNQITASSNSEIRSWELLMWFLTRTKFLVATLGDYREEYGARTASDGNASARRWYISRCIVDGAERAGCLLRRALLAEVFSYLKRHFHR